MALKIPGFGRSRRGGERKAKAAVLTDEATTVLTQLFGGSTFGRDYSVIYRQQPSVRIVIDYRARNVASLELKSYLRVDADDREEIDDHPLAQLLREPNPKTSRFRFMYDTIADLGLYDVAYWYMDRIPKPKMLVRIPVPHMNRRIRYSPMHEPIEVEYRNFRSGELYNRDQLVIFSGYSPEGAWENDDGVPPIETLRRTLEEEFTSQANRRSFWKNAARQQGSIERPLDAPEWSDIARERFRTDWDAAMTGEQNAGRTAILEEGMHWNPASFSPKDSEYIAGRQLAFNEVCLAYGINPTLFTSGQSAKNVDAFHRQIYQDTFGPLLVQVQDDIELQVLPYLDTTPASSGRIYVEFDIGAKVRASYEDTMKVLVTSAGVPILAVNEARARLNLPKIDDKAFDEPVKPANVMYGGQPAVTIPTAVPQPGGGPPPPGLNPKPVVNEPPPQLPPGKRVLRTGRKKAVPRAALQRQEAAVQEHKVLFERYFKAQRRAVKSAKAAGAPFDAERWNSRLTSDLFTARSKLAKATGALAAKQIKGVYDPTKTQAYLADTARSEAEAINAQTAQELDAVDASPDDVFDKAETSRALQLAIGTATAIIGFARVEAGKQSTREDGVMRNKTWVVTSHNSRHPELDGETIPMWDADGNESFFSNGAAWPGDIHAGIDQVAGCQCLADITV